MKLFIDTWGWITLANRKEPCHQKVKDFYEVFRSERGKLYTTDYVLSETITLLFRHLPFDLAGEEIKKIDQAIACCFLMLEWITLERFTEAKKWRTQFSDKPKISFTDLTSMVVMKELKIKDVLTADDHFCQVGMGFRKVP